MEGVVQESCIEPSPATTTSIALLVQVGSSETLGSTNEDEKQVGSVKMTLSEGGI